MSVTVILTPGTGAPEESMTVPSIVPEVTCAAEGQPKISHASKTKNGLQEESEMSRETFMVCAPFAKGRPVHPASRPGLLGFSLFGDFFQFLLQVLLIFSLDSRFLVRARLGQFSITERFPRLYRIGTH